MTGLEPVRRSTHAPQTCLSTSSSTLAFPIVSESPALSDKNYYISVFRICQHNIPIFSKIFETGLRAEFSPSLPVSPAALYAPNRICKRSLSAIIEINSLFVGLPLTPETV